jgi:hypothetical protein
MARRKGFWASRPVQLQWVGPVKELARCAMAAPNYPLRLRGAAITLLRNS